MKVQTRHILRALALGALLATALYVVAEMLRMGGGDIGVGRAATALLCIAFGVAVTVERFLRLHFSARKNGAYSSNQTPMDE